jgi:hypothetical protein
MGSNRDIPLLAMIKKVFSRQKLTCPAEKGPKLS